MNNQLSKIISPAVKNDNNDFDEVFPKKSIALNVIPKRLNLNGNLIPLKFDTKYVEDLFLVIIAALESEWFKGLASNSQLQSFQVIKKFIYWLNNQTIIENNRYSILKDYETFRVNECSVKPQSSGIVQLLNLLNIGIYATHLKSETIIYVDTIIKNTVVSIPADREPDTLNNFFSSIPWLRNSVEERDFLKLESPKRLTDSFSITIATILLFIVEQKKIAKKIISNNSFLPNETLKKRAENQFYCGNIFIRLCELDDNGQSKSDLTELMILDFVALSKRSELKKVWSKYKHRPDSIYKFKLNREGIFSLPNIFDKHSWNHPSNLEQIFLSWLLAWLAIQPSDIAKLKRSDFVVSRNQHGRPVSVYVAYYKGRSNRIHEPPMLDARQIEAQAIIAYLEELPDENTRLFKRDTHRVIPLTFGKHSIPERLGAILESKAISTQITKNLWQRQSSSLFPKMYAAVYKYKENSYSKWMTSQKLEDIPNLKISEYKNKVTHSLPSLLFGLSAIKNSAVYARTDRYRDNDLINQNSHTSLTEKSSYLTDANKDWINQNGRITRMVLHDMESYVYKPNLDTAIASTYELKLRTRVVDVLANGITNTEDFKINTLGQVINLDIDEFKLEVEPDDIIVLHTEETVVNMLHYINEAERQRMALINHALSFFEQTVLPTAEWMQSLLQESFSPVIIRQAKLNYEEIREILPPLFGNELRGGL